MSIQNQTPEKRRRPKWYGPFLITLAMKGNIQAACRAAKINRVTAYHHRKHNPDFAKAWEEALDTACDLLEEEARRRAYDGVKRKKFDRSGKPIIDPATRQQYFELEYSDTLMIFLLKAHRPEKFRENMRHEHCGPGGAPIPITSIVFAATETSEAPIRNHTEGETSIQPAPGATPGPP